MYTKPELKRGEAIHVIDDVVKRAFEGLIYCSIAVGSGRPSYPFSPYQIELSRSLIPPTQGFSASVKESGQSGSWTVRLLKADGTYYNHSTTRGGRIELEPNSFSNLPRDVDFIYNSRGEIKGEVVFAGSQGTVKSAISVAVKPINTEFRIKEYVEVYDGYFDVVVEFYAPGAASYRLAVSCVNDMSLYQYTVAGDKTTYTLHNVDGYSVNYLDMVAINQYGESIEKTIELLEMMPMASEVETHTLSAIRVGNTIKIYP